MSHRVGAGTTAARRPKRIVAVTAAVALGATTILAAGGGPAGAETAPNAQAVGRFLDGAAGGNPIQSLADLKDARAVAPGETSVQNPLDVTALGQLNIPLTNAIKVPTSPAVDAGAVNQVATANTNGKSLGAAGAVARDGGAELSSSNGGSEPTTATINLTGSALGSLPIPALPTIPGLPTGGGATNANALGGITGAIHGVFARAATKKGGDVETPSSGIADLDLTVGSPALGALITQLRSLFNTGALGGALGGLTLPTGFTLPAGCSLTDPTVSNVELTDGVTIDISNGAIEVSLRTLLKALLKKDISDLDTSNFDLVSFLVENLPSILSDGIGGVVKTLTNSLADQFTACIGVLNNLPTGTILPALLTQIITALQGGQTTLTNALSSLARQFQANNALSTLVDGLKQLVDIGLNVQSGPGIEPREKTYDYTSQLDATPNQATPVVENQTLVRAIEINVLSAAAIPGSGSGSSGVTAALANAAAGPSDVTPDAVTSSTPATSPPNVSTAVPTGIPAGQASVPSGGGVPILPIVAVLVLLAVGGGAFWQVRLQRQGGSH